MINTKNWNLAKNISWIFHDKVAYIKTLSTEIKLPDSGAEFFDLISKKKTIEEAIKLMKIRYPETPTGTLRNDYLNLFNTLTKLGIIEISTSTSHAKESNEIEIRTEKKRKESYVEKLGKITYLNNLPFYVSWDLTYRCCFNCNHCFLRTRSAKGELSIPACLKIIEKLRDLGVYSLSFVSREPFIKENFRILLKTARKFGFEVAVQSNAFALQPKDIDILKEYNIPIKISLYACDDVTYRRVTNYTGNSNVYKTVIENLFRLYENGNIIALTVFLLKENIHQVRHFNKMFEKLELEPSFGFELFRSIKGEKYPFKH